jgi:hypothetical protein
MIVPQYWAEARKQQRSGKRQVTVRRFGWSDESEDAAAAMAEARAAAALEKVLSGSKLPRRELKVPYHGADGLPIREEIVARHGDCVITRNSYGARCLNTPDALFADIDFDQPSFGGLKFKVFLGLAIVLAASVWLLWPSVWLALGMVAAAGYLASPIVDVIERARFQRAGGEQGRTHRLVDRVETFAAGHPGWSIRIYRTPAGLRTLATHKPFEPSDPAVAEYFAAIGTDPVYVLMCANQKCFRARLTAKPWRIGIAKHMMPRPGIWPVLPERLAERAGWIAMYEEKAKNFAACAFIKEVGSGLVDPKMRDIIELHDRECRAQVPGISIA